MAALAFLLLIWRIADMQIVHHSYYAERARENTLRDIPLSAERGRVFSSEGTVMVDNAIYFKLSLFSLENNDVAAILKKIGEIVPLSSKERSFVMNKAGEYSLDPIPVKDMLDYETFCKLAEIQEDCPGMRLEVQTIRKYPMKDFACHILGYDGLITEEELKLLDRLFYAPGDTVGKDGLEKQYDAVLRGRKGASKVEVDVSGRMARVVDTIFSRQGHSLELTVVPSVQMAAEQALREAITSIEARNGEKSGGAVVVMSSTGAVLAMASYPGYDPNLFARGISQKEYSSIIGNSATPLMNRAVHGAYPCASTFKLVTASAALQEGLAGADEHFYCPGFYDLGGHIFNCFVTSGHGDVSFRDSIAYSCDVVYYMLARKFKLESFLKYIASYGVGSKTGVDLPGETPGLLPDPFWKREAVKEEWYPGDTVNLSIGQGFIEVTPLQVARFTMAVANGGTLYRPYLVNRIITFDGKEVSCTKPEAERKVPIEDRHLQVVREGMRDAVLYGTAGAVDVSYVEVAGKTGTAENFPTPENPYGRNHTWFTSFAPYGRPEVIVTVFLEKSGGFGGELSTKVAGKVYEKMYKKETAPSGRKKS